MHRLGHLCSLAAAAAITLAAVSGCSDANDPRAMLEDYVARVENATETEAAADQPFESNLLAYPERRERRLPLAELRIGMLDFLALIKCEMQEIVGERNSSLGKVMPVSQQLIYEHRLLVSARECRRQLEDEGNGDSELQQTLDEVVQIKSTDLPRAYWNATFGSPEFEHMFSLAAPPLRVGADGGPHADIERALQQLASLGERLGNGTLELESAPLEAQYQTLMSRRMAGELLRALELLRFHLDGAARIIETRLAARPVCYQERPTPRARILETVFQKYYAGKVQPYLARVHRLARAWLEAVNRLAAAQREQMTPAFAAYFEAQLSMDAGDAPWARYQQALGRHTDAWQSLLGQCGLMPGSASASG